MHKKLGDFSPEEINALLNLVDVPHTSARSIGGLGGFNPLSYTYY